jgi:alpha-tubulin suppressor-like RCC1 family protein
MRLVSVKTGDSAPRAPERLRLESLRLATRFSIGLVVLCACGARSQLDGAGVADAAPLDVASGTRRPIAIAASAYDTTVMLSDGTVERWGLEDVRTTNVLAVDPVPTPVARVHSAVAIATGGDTDFGPTHGCASLGDGTVACWGGNHSGELGDGTTTDSSAAVTVTGVTGATGVAAGSGHSCALLAGGNIECWGDNSFGQLGNGTLTNSTTPVDVLGITGATAISAGGAHTCALLAGGTVDCWGENGDGTNVTELPTPVPGLSNITSISAGTENICVLRDVGTVTCWMASDVNDFAVTTTPTDAPGVSQVLTVATGADFACAVSSEQTVSCWGDNGSGQAGNGTIGGIASPSTIQGLVDVRAVAAGVAHGCALLGNGEVDCWGSVATADAGLAPTAIPVPVPF